MSPDVSASCLPSVETKAILAPSGDHDGNEERRRVSRRRPRPSAFIRSISPVRLLSKAIVLPSGDQAGIASLAPLGVSRCRPLPSTFMTSITVRPRLPVKAIRRPSGDQLGYELI